MDNLITAFKVLSDETRLRILVLLQQESLCVCELTGILNTAQPYVSRNLSKLRDLNLVKDERRDKYIFYSIKPDQKFLIDLLQTILNNIENYPTLQQDSQRLPLKETLKCSSSNG